MQTAITPLAQALDNLSRRGPDHTEASGTRGHLERDMSFTCMHIMLAFSDTEEVGRGGGKAGMLILICDMW